MEQMKLEFTLDYINILENDNDVSIVQLDLLHLGENRNKCDISRDCIDKSIKTFFNKPIIYRLNNKFFIGESTDVVEHARNEEEEKTTFIAGTIPESSPVEFVDRDDKTYVRMVGVIHKLYQKTLMNILENRNGEVKVSIELKVVDGYQNEDGILIINEFKLLSVCLLGEGINEGILGSQMVVTKFSMDDFNQHYITFSQSKKDYEIPDTIKNNAQKALDLKKQYKRGMNSNTVSIAKYLINNQVISQDKIDSIRAYFSNISNEDIQEDYSNEYITYLGFGGKECFTWINSINNSKNQNVDSTDKNVLDNINIKNADVNETNKEKDGDNVIKEAVEKFSLTSNQIYDILYSAVGDIKYKSGEYEWCKYWVSDYDDNFVILYDNEEEKRYQVSYTIENNAATVNFDTKKEVIRGGWEVVGESSSMTNSEDEVKVNSEENDEDLKQKYADLEEKFNEKVTECKNALDELQKYKDAEEDAKKMSLVEEFAHCYSEEEMSEIKNKLSTMTYTEVDTEVTNKAKEFAKNAKVNKDNEKEEDKEDDVVKNSLNEENEKDKEDDGLTKILNNYTVSPFGAVPSFDFSKNLGEGGLDSIIKNSNIKLK